MKRILSITGILGLAFLFVSAITIREIPQDPPKGKKVTKHIKMVKVDEDGNKVEIDTIIEDDNVFVWQGDTIGNKKGMKWTSKGDHDMDIDIEEVADGKVIIMKLGKSGKPVIHGFKMDGNSEETYRVKVISDGDSHGNHNVMMFNGDDDNEMRFHGKGGDDMMFGAPHAPKVIKMKMHNQGNVIDLSDPGIIKYEKKDLKDGKEKITIIRHKPAGNDVKVNANIIMKGSNIHPKMLVHGKPLGKSKTIKVKKSDDGNIEIFENGELIEIKEGAEKGTFITDDGKIINIREIKKGKTKKVEVTVEEEIEENK